MSLSLGLSASATVQRKGNTLIVPRGASLPAACVKCGQPVTGPGAKRTYRWHPKWVYALLLIGLIFYAAGLVFLNRKVELFVPVCENHLRRRRQLLKAGLIVLAGAPISLFLDPVIGTGYSILLFIACVLGSLILISPARSLMRPVFIDEGRAEFEGLNEAFLCQVEGPVDMP